VAAWDWASEHGSRDRLPSLVPAWEGAAARLIRSARGVLLVGGGRVFIGLTSNHLSFSQDAATQSKTAQHSETMADGRRGDAMGERRPGGSAIVRGRRDEARADG
jgi:hypothetical protein